MAANVSGWVDWQHLDLRGLSLSSFSWSVYKLQKGDESLKEHWTLSLHTQIKYHIICTHICLEFVEVGEEKTFFLYFIVHIYFQLLHITNITLRPWWIFSYYVWFMEIFYMYLLVIMQWFPHRLHRPTTKKLFY